MSVDVVEPRSAPYGPNRHDREADWTLLGLETAQASTATDVLRKAGLIHYDDGEITVLDRSGVELRSCECYGVVKTESDRLLAYQSKT